MNIAKEILETVHTKLIVYFQEFHTKLINSLTNSNKVVQHISWSGIMGAKLKLGIRHFLASLLKYK